MLIAKKSAIGCNELWYGRVDLPVNKERVRNNFPNS
jgi:hypothetical protein